MDFNFIEEHIMICNAVRNFAQTKLLPDVIEHYNKQEFPKEQIKKWRTRFSRRFIDAN